MYKPWILIATGLVSGIAAAPVAAAIITWDFAGNVTSNSYPGSTTIISGATSFTGTFSYDDSAASNFGGPAEYATGNVSILFNTGFGIETQSGNLTTLLEDGPFGDRWGFNNLLSTAMLSPVPPGVINILGVEAEFFGPDTSITNPDTLVGQNLALSQFSDSPNIFKLNGNDGGTGGGGTPEEFAFDGSFTSFSSSAAVPEPSTFALLGIGAFGLIGFRRRKRKQVVRDL